MPLCTISVVAVLLASVQPAGGDSGHEHPAIERRPLDLAPDADWAGRGVCYGPHRDGQTPDAGPQPTKEQVREDLHLLDPRFDLVRMYGSGNASRFALEVIHEDHLGLKLMLGAWIGSETNADGPIVGAKEANEAQIETLIEQANAFPDEILALNVGNETQVSWTGHRVDRETLIGYIRRVRENTTEPVTTCDDFNFWNKPESDAAAAEVDFIGLHAYAMWNGQSLVDALTWTREQIDDIARKHPGLPVVFAESGWATQKHAEGEQSRLIKGDPGEKQQELYYRAFTSWAEDARQPYFYFEAFDETWKGGDHPDEVEKHWGLWNSDRTPKLAVETPTPREE